MHFVDETIENKNEKAPESDEKHEVDGNDEDITKLRRAADQGFSETEYDGYDRRQDGGESADMMFEDLTLDDDDFLAVEVDDQGEGENATETTDDIEMNQDAVAPTQASQSDASLDLEINAPDTNVSAGQSTDLVNTEQAAMNKGRIGDMMVAMGMIDENQLNVALQEKKVSNKMMGEILVDLGFIEQDDLIQFLSKSSGFKVFDPRTAVFEDDALAVLDKVLALQLKVLPISIENGCLHVAMADPYDVLARDTLRKNMPSHVSLKPVVASEQILIEAIDAAYGYNSAIGKILKELENDKDIGDVADLDEEEALSHPIVRLVNALVADAVKIGASDLHFEPEENFIRLRYRLDGVLFTAQTLHKQHWNAISQRIKILSHMNIADKINMQDGRFGMEIGGRDVDFRVSSLPTVFGENIVLRVLDKSSSIMPLSKLGFSEHNKNLILKAQRRPEGIVIVTGPTGSGKTTSLYSMLNEINTVDVNIQTLEDPVEYSLPMIRQTHVREGVLDFADGIKALLRQDPDIIFIGEVRDKTTAEMALKAAMTGHQVYTTLHTNDSFGAIPRLLDLGLKPGMIAGAIVAVFAQRLARRLCTECKEEHTPTDEELAIINYKGEDPMPTIYHAKQGGCNQCGGTGYKGRVAVVEILSFDEEMDDILAAGANKAELKAEAIKKGFQSMKDDGMLKVLEGTTDLAALSKVVDIYK